MSTDLRYVRTRGGRVVHRAGCSVLKTVTRGHEWRWAEGKTRAEIEAEAVAVRLPPFHWCERCRP